MPSCLLLFNLFFSNVNMLCSPPPYILYSFLFSSYPAIMNGLYSPCSPTKDFNQNRCFCASFALLTRVCKLVYLWVARFYCHFCIWVTYFSLVLTLNKLFYLLQVYYLYFWYNRIMGDIREVLNNNLNWLLGFSRLVLGFNRVVLI